MKHVVPILESERGWGMKVDGYAGPFENRDAADVFRKAFNAENCTENEVPDWYLAALEPTKYVGQECTYKPTI